MTDALRYVQTNARGVPAGSSHHWTRFDDTVVATARRLAAEGVGIAEITRRLGSPTLATVWRWVHGHRRKPIAKVVVRRVKKRIDKAEV